VIVVSDTTPLNYLVLVGAIDVLPLLFQEVFAPPSVIAELTQLRTPPLVSKWAGSPPPWLKVVAPSTRLASTVLLGDGEGDALSLAKELRITDVLIDERRGRNIAVREGLIPLPTLAVLERAAAQHLLHLPTTLERLAKTNFRVPQERIDEALRRDAVRKRSEESAP
jgi:predicted nucleic acid-binding protein